MSGIQIGIYGFIAHIIVEQRWLITAITPKEKSQKEFIESTSMNEVVYDENKFI